MKKMKTALLAVTALLLIIAMPAQIDMESKGQFATDPPWSVLGHLDQFDPVGRPVFLLAGHLTGFTAPAKVVVYCQRYGSHGIIPSSLQMAGVRSDKS